MKISASGLSVLIGGARSGKSDRAVQLGTAWPGHVVFVATAEGRDDDMAARIERHRNDRPSEWATFESAGSISSKRTRSTRTRSSSSTV